MSEPTQPYDVVQQCAKAREEAEARANTMTIEDAVGHARWLRRTPDGMLEPQAARRVIDTLFAAIESSPCFYKGITQGIPTFTLLAYDRAGHIALRMWGEEALLHGCRPAKAHEAFVLATEWSKRPDCRWPT